MRFPQPSLNKRARLFRRWRGERSRQRRERHGADHGGGRLEPDVPCCRQNVDAFQSKRLIVAPDARLAKSGP
jgi:hypothetical protein